MKEADERWQRRDDIEDGRPIRIWVKPRIKRFCDPPRVLTTQILAFAMSRTDEDRKEWGGRRREPEGGEQNESDLDN